MAGAKPGHDVQNVSFLASALTSSLLAAMRYPVKAAAFLSKFF
jgi:hypothetical protein